MAQWYPRDLLGACCSDHNRGYTIQQRGISSQPGSTQHSLRMAKGAKTVMVMLQSLAGTGHRLVRLRPKLADKMEEIALDPYVQKKVLYREVKKIRTLKTK